MNPEKEITNLLMSIQRDGMGRMVDFLETSDFFTAPASTKYHLAYSGGLAEHSLSVRETLLEMNNVFNTNIPSDSIDIVSLLQDRV